MPDPLRKLLEHNVITPLSYYFAQFIAQQSQQTMDSILCFTAALVSHRNQQGDICINLNDYANGAFFETHDVDDGYLIDEHSIQAPNTQEWIKQLSDHSCVSLNFNPQALLLDGESLYLGKLWFFEDFIAKQIKNRLNQTPSIDTPLLKNGLIHLFGSDSTKIDWQRIAASIAVKNSFSVISGGPGTGKTTTLIKVLVLLIEQNNNINIQLCAPTGKAAIRMLEAINSRKKELNIDQKIIEQLPKVAKTIHRLLKYQNGTFKANATLPLAIDCLVIDEASMIDLELMYHVMSALPEHCRVILLGDKDQLSSVDAGHVFSDICGRGQSVTYSQLQTEWLTNLNDLNAMTLEHKNNKSNISDAIALLKTSFRFTADSAIGQVAKLVNEGQGEAALNYLKQHQQDLSFINIEEGNLPKQVIDLALNHYQHVVEAACVEDAFKALAKFQILCAVHKGPFGNEEINELITQRLLLRHKINAIDQYNGKPILILQNDYENNLFNGDIGILWKIDNQYLVFFEQDDGGLKSYPLISLQSYKTAWAMTVHKSQGSEYDSVLLLIADKMTHGGVNRELIYTGITRAKSSLSVCCSEQVFIASCVQKTHRSSNLSKKLGW